MDVRGTPQAFAFENFYSIPWLWKTRNYCCLCKEQRALSLSSSCATKVHDERNEVLFSVEFRVNMQGSY